ncbi:hemolysin-iii channel protein [Ophiostoma piceae UAMH 11346]|uniref:Hemolysin-iii channel protein n=1 Tax=Ophiostoma piceae (strain UAMH 11346) TaxID=1262450 RepID=S3CY79_OPHP1|nr:hemolysin-iii channel protein [Ophiostoma piceae UAMH 11346]
MAIAVVTPTQTDAKPHTASTLRQRSKQLAQDGKDDDDDDDAAVQQQLAAESRRYSKQRQRLLLWTELCEARIAARNRHRHGSDGIRTGYRQETPSALACLASWFYLHNESVNILSHVAGAGLFAGLVATLWAGTWPWQPGTDYAGSIGNSTGDLLAATVYLAGVTICFTLSATYHTLLCHSPGCAACGMALDISGVLLLMAGATTPLIHFGLVCAASDSVRWIFHALAAVLGALCVASSTRNGPPSSATPLLTSSLLGYFSGPANGHRRVLLFCGFAAVSFAGPIVWMAYVTKDPDWPRRIDLWPGVLGTLFFNTLGAVAYLLRFPEHIWPRRFDLVGASHQIMHIAVLAAAISLAIGVGHSLSFRRGEGAVCRV